MVAYGTQSKPEDTEGSQKQGDVIEPRVGYITSKDINRQSFETALADNLAFATF